MAISTTGITTTAVGTTLGTSSRNVSALCTNTNINPWSKKKPVELNNPAPSRSDTWWKADNGCCGFKQDSVYFGTSAANLVTAYKNGTTYIYEKPTTYKRLADFGGYDHTAKCPCWSVSVMGTLYKDSPSTFIEVMANWNLDATSNTNNLQITDLVPQDLFNANECYFGIIVLYNNTYYYKTSANKVSATSSGDGWFVQLSTSEFNPAVGTYTVYPALFSLPVTTFGSSGGGTRFIAIPPPTSGTFQTTFTVKNSSLDNTIMFFDVYYQQGAKLTIGGTIGYIASLEGSNVSISYSRTRNGVKSSFGNTTLKLTQNAGTYGNYSLCSFSNSYTQSTQSGDIYSVSASYNTYTITSDCDQQYPD